MTLVVPLMTQSSAEMRSPSRLSRSNPMIGSPAPTVASKYRRTPCSAARALSRGPEAAITALLAVTTVLPARSAASIRPVAGSVPPIASTTIATAGSATTAWGSPTTRTFLRSKPREREVSRTATQRSAGVAPARSPSSSHSAMSRLATAVPTVPSPSKPIPTDSIAGTVYGGLDDVASPGQQHRRRPVLAAELLEDVAHVRLHGVLAEEEEHGDLRVVLAIGHQTQHVTFAPGDRGHVLGGIADQLRVEKGLARGHRANGAGQFLARRVLQEIPERPGLERRKDVVLVAVGGEHDHPRLGIARPDLAERFDAVHHRHLDVEEDHVGMGPACLLDGLDAVGCSSHHLDVGLELEHGAETVPDHRMVIGDENAYHALTASGTASVNGSLVVIVVP